MVVMVHVPQRPWHMGHQLDIRIGIELKHSYWIALIFHDQCFLEMFLNVSTIPFPYALCKDTPLLKLTEIDSHLIAVH